MTDDVHHAALSAVEQAIINQPRSLQRVIGPSEIGTACTHCLAAKLANWEEKQEAAWLPALGTAFHSFAEQIFIPLDEWLTEVRVKVGRIGFQEVWGTSDLFHIPTGTVVDLKLVGATTLKKAKGGPTNTYRVQVHSYGVGQARAGHQVNNVAIWYVPRNAVSLSSGIWWSEPFDPMVAIEALDRATEIAAKLNELEAVSVEARDEYIRGLPRDKDCFSCSRYPDWSKPVPQMSTLDELAGFAA